MYIVEKKMFGAVVVLYNPTKDEIKNINTYKNLVAQTIVIVNSETSHRELVDQIVTLDSKVIYYSAQKNIGLCKALNMGIKILTENGCQWTLVFDADSKMGSDIVTVYKKAIDYYSNLITLESNEIAVFAPVHVFERSKNRSYQGYKDVEWVMTSGCLFNCEIFKKQNGFMEELFVDGLDMDYCFKSHEKGYRIIECGEAVINHHPAETKSFLGFKYGIASPNRYYMQARALIWCWKRYKKPRMFGFYLYKWFKVLFLFPNKKMYVRKMIEGTKEANKLLKNLQKDFEKQY